MFYVLFECNTVYSDEAPKDHTMICSIAYHVISAETLQPVWQSPKEFQVDETHSLQMLIQTLETDVTAAVGTEEFVICSLGSIWHIRVTLPRQARDESWLLPPFMQHPKLFDLWREVNVWVSNHPERCGKTTDQRNKQNISTKFNKNWETLSYLLGDGAAETLNLSPIEQCSKVLITLHSSCSTEKDQELVLTHPYNSNLDIKCFLQEKSKVLYINNLPQDTTQSELESWFTQFGSRPVGFWTVKNVVEVASNSSNSNNSLYVDEPDSISGFVVYQTHEEALDSLSLNGRSILSNMSNTKQPRVVEHVVEIQTSSATVLEKVQEILSPFPQSKNRPRPGDWTCPSCAFSNFQRRTACFRCSFPASSAVQVNKNGYNKIQTQQANNGTQYSKSRSQTADYNDNVQNQQQLLLGQLASAQDFSQKMKMQQQQRFGYSNRAMQSSQVSLQGGATNGSKVPFRAGDWKCTICTYHNFAKNVVCLRCGGPKNPAVNTTTATTTTTTNTTTTTPNDVYDFVTSATVPTPSPVYATNERTIPVQIADGFGLSLSERSSSEPTLRKG